LEVQVGNAVEIIKTYFCHVSVEQPPMGHQFTFPTVGWRDWRLGRCL